MNFLKNPETTLPIFTRKKQNYEIHVIKNNIIENIIKNNYTKNKHAYIKSYIFTTLYFAAMPETPDQ